MARISHRSCNSSVDCLARARLEGKEAARNIIDVGQDRRRDVGWYDVDEAEHTDGGLHAGPEPFLSPEPKF